MTRFAAVAVFLMVCATTGVYGATLQSDQTWTVDGTYSVPLDLNGFTLTLDSNWQFTDVISGGGQIILRPRRSLALSVLHTATATLTVDRSNLWVVPGGAWPGPIVANGGWVSLSAPIYQKAPDVGPLTIGSGSTLHLSSVHTPTSRGLTMAAGATFSTWRCYFGVICSLSVKGTVDLGGAWLSLSSAAPLIRPMNFPLIHNDGVDPVRGEFKGWPEGVVQGPGRTMVTYKGGSGNDVVFSTLPWGQPTKTSLATSNIMSILGRPVTLTATVTPAPTGTPTGSGVPPTPTGTVTFFDEQQSLGIVPLDAAGQAQITINTLPPGNHAISATYSGDIVYNHSTSTVLAQAVVEDIPLLDPRLLVMLAALLAIAGMAALRR